MKNKISFSNWNFFFIFFGVPLFTMKFLVQNACSQWKSGAVALRVRNRCKKTFEPIRKQYKFQGQIWCFDEFYKEWTMSIIYCIIINYVKPLVFELDIAILFQFMKILKKKGWKKTTHEKWQMFFHWSTHLKMSFCASSNCSLV